MDLETNLTLRDDKQWTSAIVEAEAETKQSPGDCETDAFDPLSLDIPSTVQKLNGASGFLSLIERETEAVLLHLEQARCITLSLQVLFQGHEEATRKLINHIDFLVESRKNVGLRLRNLQQRSQLQLTFVCTYAEPFFSTLY